MDSYIEQTKIKRKSRKTYKAKDSSVGFFFYRKVEKPDFKSLEWQLPIEDFPKAGLRENILEPNTQFLIKAFLETSFAAIMTVFLIPVYIIIGLLIAITTPGPIIFKQDRIGMDGKKFKILKFRTMYIDAEKVKEKLYSRNEAHGPVFKIQNDPRITVVGKFLRKTGLDELPQLWNVVKGDMFLIGPRPPLENEVWRYEEWQKRRLSVKPGITCTWQIQPNRHDITFEEWVDMDLKYIDEWTLKKDVSIFFKTIKTFFVAGGH